MKRLLLFALTSAVCLAQEQAAKSGQVAESSDGWKWANFAILVIGLGYLCAKYLPPFFRSRTESIQRGIVEAQQMKHDAERRAAEMDARMNALGSEIEKFRTQAHAEMEREGERIREETAVQIGKLERQAEVEIESAGKSARRELRSYASDLALDLAEQRIRARLDASTEAALIDNFLDDLERRESNN
ncbi:MAG TPA: ATP synthase F0 subunit B [Bryobacteraceae bacterium]|nr:ATP synthase F0 subunit B [Bryobacteraceae bacterium]